MKKFATTLTIITIMIMFWLVPAVQAADQLLDVTIESAVEKIDKNGNAYVRFIIPVEKNLNGIAYTDTVPVNAYSTNVETARTYKAGDQLKAIVKFKEYQGSSYGTVQKFITE